MTLPIRIALLLCDTPIPAVQSTDGDYTAIFNTLLRNSLPLGSGTDYILDSYDVRNKQEYPRNVDDYQAIILTGSAASAYENVDWINRLIDYVHDIALNKPYIKLIGICFGHQIIARAMGGECVPNGGKWEVGVTEIALTDIGKTLLGVPTLNIQQMHRDHVPAVPPSFHLLGSTPVSPNQGMVRFASGTSVDHPMPQDVQIFTVQGHPEFTQRISEKIVEARERKGVMGKDIAEDARKRAEWRNDGVGVIGKVMWEIMGVGAGQAGAST
ncbi:class I glutamine amidotransferase-like protein [Laetiporus sulphureus 93-53]|uniref:Class I glutamine amidotransferase-like protein n=1 Tax=Laetiporus sulphureus 93-53 TaxID=1314785 RepID=A0A165CWX5_9APHY|nr:class I glutamine amidotransferase-like protein [Laetiporus sulphureus 93-53]KZT03619.1 class I glutamine amidotransferase-like protein [Laetiporus sulphureus 93-53]